MPMYDQECSECGSQYEIIQSMQERGADKQYPLSPCCNAKALRIFSPAADPNGESAFRSFYSEQLSDTEIPVEIRSRAQLKGELIARGLRQYDGDEFRSQMKAVKQAKEQKRQNAIEAESRILYQAGLNPERERAHNATIRAGVAQRRS